MYLKEIKIAVREVLKDLEVPVDVSEIKDNSSLQQEYAFDSILLMEFMLLLEEKFQIQFDENLTLESLDSIGEISKYISMYYSV